MELTQQTAILAQGLDAMGLTLSEGVVSQLLQLLDCLEQWNQTFNLTAITDRQEMIVKHLLDSLSLIPWLDGERCLDVGTGAGFPGLPLAMACPQKQFVLLDANGKKTRFVQQVCATLRLTNVKVVHARMQDFHPDILFDVVMSRAVSQLQQMIEMTSHLCQPQGCMLVMKSGYPTRELAELGPLSTQVLSLNVPGLEAERHLVKIEVKEVLHG